MRRVGGALAAAGLALTLLSGAPAAATGRPVSTAVHAATPAQAPFPHLTATTVHLDGGPLLVVVAQTDTEREQGLRQRATLGPYRGMLFVFDSDTSVGFTMSTVPVSLDIGFYRANGSSVGRLRMRPCPHAESQCPVYQAHHSFRYALETPAGRLPRGALTG